MSANNKVTRAASFLLALLLLFTLAAPRVSLALTAQTQYTVKSSVNVRSGPGTNYKIIGRLDKGGLIYGVASAAKNWINVSYNGQSAYVSSSYLKATGVTNKKSAESAEPEQPTNIVYTIRKTDVTSRTGSSAPVVDTLLIGVRCKRLDIRGDYTQVSFDGGSGFVKSRDLVYIKDTGAYQLTTLNGWRYSRSHNNNAYVIPIESEGYTVGYFSKNEPIWAINSNKYWTQVYVHGRTAYVPTANLLTTPTTPSREIVSTGPYLPGTFLTVKKGGAQPYETYTLRNPYTPAYEDFPYEGISEGTKVLVMFSTNKYAQIIWDDDRDYEIGTGVDFPTNLQCAYVGINTIG